MKRRSHLDRPQSPLFSTTMSLRRFNYSRAMKTKSKLLGLVIKVLLENEKCFLCYSTFGAILKSGCRGTHFQMHLQKALHSQTPNPKQVVISLQVVT